MIDAQDMILSQDAMDFLEELQREDTTDEQHQIEQLQRLSALGEQEWSIVTDGFMINLTPEQIANVVDNS